jgi:hypothetical protein
MHHRTTSLIFVFLAALFALSGCEGQAGPQGERGPQGQPGIQGEIGPAGDPGKRKLHRVFFSSNQDIDNGLVPDRALSFTKVDDAAVLRLTYFDGFRVFGNGGACACRWTMLLNGKTCTDPGKIIMDATTGVVDSSRATTLTAYCNATQSGPFIGDVDVTVNVLSSNNCDCQTGFDGVTGLIEAEEVAP